MKNELREKQPGSVLFIPHGGGPLPLLGEESHEKLVAFLQGISQRFVEPAAIVVISAHWEEERATITSASAPPLLYDYSGFPDAAYKIEYPAPGHPILAHKMYDLLQESGVEARLDAHRPFDHGLFIPLKLMYPGAAIPCVQLSLLKSLDPERHIRIGRALSALRKENILILGSGFSFHNLRALLSDSGGPDTQNEAFNHWLVETCTNPVLSSAEREKRLIAWSDAPFARYCHPREEHLLPLHVCCGLTDSPAKIVFDGKVMGKKVSAFLW
ncbi:MAG: dioxygenase [Proteobacteria bacterium]|nr:dioxygenase [Pseudomonadota bacterium]MBU1058495.1 dioxygenase [Pseudomonadota bacterium]